MQRTLITFAVFSLCPASIVCGLSVIAGKIKADSDFEFNSTIVYLSIGDFE